jgi:hypothetical protein
LHSPGDRTVIRRLSSQQEPPESIQNSRKSFVSRSNRPHYRRRYGRHLLYCRYTESLTEKNSVNIAAKNASSKLKSSKDELRGWLASRSPAFAYTSDMSGLDTRFNPRRNLCTGRARHAKVTTSRDWYWRSAISLSAGFPPSAPSGDRWIDRRLRKSNDGADFSNAQRIR